MLLSKRRHFLGVLAIFRNEAHILSEWCDHYLAQGATKIVLLNHYSTDDYQTTLAPYVRSGHVELIDVYGDRPQLSAYNSLRAKFRRECRWLLICDLDEFFYGRRGHTVASYLRTLPWNVSEVVVPWKNFGSSNHIAQPAGLVTQNFLFRWRYDSCTDQHVEPSSVGPFAHLCPWCKYIVRTSRIRFLSVHSASIWYGRIVDGGGHSIARSESGCFSGILPLTEELLSQSFLHLNHYAIQSKEHFQRVKLARPDIHRLPQDNPKCGLDYFYAFDRNEIYDSELSRLHNRTSHS